MVYKLVCSKCGYTIAEYGKTGQYDGIPSPAWFSGKVCPRCGYRFKGKAKKIIFDDEVVYTSYSGGDTKRG